MVFDKILLFPYYAILTIRNFAYDKRWLKSYSFSTPTICVGNITVGGTGKTPHIEELIRIFKTDYKIAIISRGYGRKTKGYREVKTEDDFSLVGDEPLQIKRKFPEVIVVVDESRKEAIERLEALPKGHKPTLILLDDAFQHRKVKPTISILLVNYQRPIYDDSLLPLGRLRDLKNQSKRADIVIVTKVPTIIDNNDEMEWRRKLNLNKAQELLFTTMVNGELQTAFPECDKRYLYSKSAIVFSGIANDSMLISYIKNDFTIKGVLAFGDHHSYKKSDIQSIAKLATKNPSCMIITTEKDFQRIRNFKKLPTIITERLVYISTHPEFIFLGNENGISYDEERKIIALGQFKKSIENLLVSKK